MWGNDILLQVLDARQHLSESLCSVRGEVTKLVRQVSAGVCDGDELEDDQEEEDDEETEEGIN